MKKNCFLITCEFPYMTGEPFLENEIKFLSNKFEKIYLFAINASKKDVQTRVVPDNVQIFPLNCIFSKLRYPVYMLSGLLDSEEELKIKEDSIKKILISFYARGRANIILKKILEIIKIKNFSVDNSVVYSYWFTDQSIVAWKIKKYFNNSNIKSVCRAHGYDLYWERNFISFLPYQNVSLKNLDGVFPCSDNGSEYIKEKYPMYIDKIVTSRLGTLDYCYKEELSIKNIVTCCSLYKNKRISLFAKAFSRVAKKDLDCKWVCIGDGEEFEEIKKIIKENGIENRVEFKGRLKNKEVIEYYKKNDVYLFSNISIYEGLPVVIMEVLSFGIPVLATKAGGTDELVSDKNGKLLEINITEEKLADEILSFLNMSKETYKEKRRSARKIWEERASAEINYKKWCDILGE